MRNLAKGRGWEIVVTALGLIAATLVVALVTQYEHQRPVLMWKLTCIMAGGLVSAAIDHILFKRGGELQDQVSELTRAAVLVRRGIVVGAGMLACAVAV